MPACTSMVTAKTFPELRWILTLTMWYFGLSSGCRVWLLFKGELMHERYPEFITMVLTLDRTNCANGLPPASVLGTYNSRNIPIDTLAGIPQDLHYQLRLAQILTDSTVELGKCALSIEGPAEARVLQSMIDVFSSHLTEIESDCSAQLSKSPTREVMALDWLHQATFICSVSDCRFKASTFLFPNQTRATLHF